MIEVDLLTPLAPGEMVHPDASAALREQGCVRFRHHFVEGRRRPRETRVETIARARNEAARCGNAHFAMFLDRDVVLPPRALEKLAFALCLGPPGYAALGINYQGEQPSPARHVAMGAVMFHRPILGRIRFRSEPGRCECLCCCEDIRRMGYAIDYLPGLRARHAKAARPSPPPRGRGSTGSSAG